MALEVKGEAEKVVEKDVNKGVDKAVDKGVNKIVNKVEQAISDPIMTVEKLINTESWRLSGKLSHRGRTQCTSVCASVVTVKLYDQII
jgi:hypothetical protein